MSNETTARPAWLQAGAECVTRDGRRAKVYAIDNDMEQPIVGRIVGCYPSCWQSDGAYSALCGQLGSDIVGPYIERPSMDESALPAWAEWYAMDKSGAWWWYSEDVSISDFAWSFVCDIDPNAVCYGGTIPPAYAPKWSGDWRNSKVRVGREGGAK